MLDCCWQSGGTALHAAVRHNHAGIVRDLLQHGAQPDAPNQVSYTTHRLHIRRVVKKFCNIQVSVSAVFCLDILQLYSIGLSFDWHSVYFVQL